MKERNRCDYIYAQYDESVKRGIAKVGDRCSNDFTAQYTIGGEIYHYCQQHAKEKNLKPKQQQEEKDVFSEMKKTMLDHLASTLSQKYVLADEYEIYKILGEKQTELWAEKKALAGWHATPSVYREPQSIKEAIAILGVEEHVAALWVKSGELLALGKEIMDDRYSFVAENLARYACFMGMYEGDQSAVDKYAKYFRKKDDVDDETQKIADAFHKAKEKQSK